MPGGERAGRAHIRVRVRGTVQGVGFRPFVYRLARHYGLGGYVLNDTDGVLAEVEGPQASVEGFIADLRPQAPPLASIDEIVTETVADSIPPDEFRIVQSRQSDDAFVPVSPDVATCTECLVELQNPKDRRYRYPFLNCTNCGPRFSIVEDIPYDRSRTTMAEFAMCQRCQEEYQEPTNRRFHAQPNACRDCGPRLFLTDAAGRLLVHEDTIAAAVSLILHGQIGAIKGLGGYHLCCDATRAEAIMRLRSRKRRNAKPFALMMADIEEIEFYCHISSAERHLLLSPARPIVLLRRRDDCMLSKSIAPGNHCLGVMLPYTPLHYLLCQQASRPLVMTSGNVSEEPIAYGDEEAYARLSCIADFFLTHNRRIHTRIDDSVLACVEEKTLFFRRSRGYAPRPFYLQSARGGAVLAVGGHLKNTFCWAHDGLAIVSHHIGDLENLEAVTAFEESVEHYRRLFRCQVPSLVVCDLHPAYASTAFARRYADNNSASVHQVQHHHAHVAAVLGEHHMDDEVIGVIFDGTGYGADGTVWGGEFLLADRRQYRRVGKLRSVGLPGAEAAVREPWRMGLSCLFELYGPEIPPSACQVLLDMVESRRFSRALRLLASGVRTPKTSSAGRLFDAVASLLGLRSVNEYEGQAAIELEQLAMAESQQAYSFDIDAQQGMLTLDTMPMLGELLADLKAGKQPALVAGKFHQMLAEAILQVCQAIRGRTRHERVVLGGGVFQNRLLLELAVKRLRRGGFRVFWPHVFPPGDGGLSFGQAVVGCSFLNKPGILRDYVPLVKG